VLLIRRLSKVLELTTPFPWVTNVWSSQYPRYSTLPTETKD